MLYFRIGIDFRYCDFYMLILGLCESESESQSGSESESGDIYVGLATSSDAMYKDIGLNHESIYFQEAATLLKNC